MSGILSVCPYYQADSSVRITCEGIEEGQNIKLAFAKNAQKGAWMKRYCKRMAYCACPVAQMIAVQQHRRKAGPNEVSSDANA